MYGWRYGIIRSDVQLPFEMTNSFDSFGVKLRLSLDVTGRCCDFLLSFTVQLSTTSRADDFGRPNIAEPSDCDIELSISCSAMV